MYLLSLCARLSQQSHLFPICVVSTYNDSRKDLHRLCQIPNYFRIPIWLQELLQASLCFLRSFCFARIRLDPLGGQVLHHDCISMIATFTENFVICCNQITKIFCKRYDSANASSARRPCDFGPLADLAISVFGKWAKTLCSPKSAHLAGVGSENGSWEELACESLCSGTLSSTIFSLNSCSHSRMSEFNRSPRSRSWTSFLFGFWIFGWLSQQLLFWCSRRNTGLSVLAFQHVYLTQLRDRNLSPHSPLRACLATLSLDTVEDVMVGEVDGLEEDVGWSISCLEGVMDVEEGKLEEELVDKPGTTIGTMFSVLHCIRIPFLMSCGFWPLINSYEYPCSSQSFQSDKTAGVSSRTFIVKKNPTLWRKLWPLHASALRHWLSWPSLDFSTSPKYPIQRNSSPFLLIMCIDAPESTTNSLSSGFRVNGAGRHFSEGEKNVVLFFSFNFYDIFGQPPRCFTGTSLWPFCLFLKPILKFWSIGVTLMRITWAKISERRILVSNFSVTRNSLRELNTWGLRRLHILKYATQLSCNFQFSHCTFVTILLRPFARLFINLAMRMRALFPKSASIFGLVEQAFWRMPLFTEWSGASSFEVILARQSSHFPTWASASGTSGSRCIFSHSAA